MIDMLMMNKAKKNGLRIHDISDGLREVSQSGPLTDFSNTLLIGKSASLALHLKGHDVITNMDAFKYAAGELGIGVLELNTVLAELQELDFIRSYTNKIEVKVPNFSDAYERLGERWDLLRPTELESKTVEILSRLETSPIKSSKIKNDFHIPDSEWRIIQEVGESGAYLGNFYLPNGESITYSPALTELNPEKIYDFTSKHSEQALSSLLNELKSFQGKPLDHVSSNIVLEARHAGILLSTTIGTGSTKKEYLFAPMEKVNQENKVILDKARALLSCVRCGEFHTQEGSKINNAALILNAMRTRKKLGAHSAHATQYGLIIGKGLARLGTPDRVRSSLEIIDSEENIAAINLAIEMLNEGSGRLLKTQQSAHQYLTNPSSYSNPTMVRVRYQKELKKSRQTQEEVIKKVSQMNQGIYSVFD